MVYTEPIVTIQGNHSQVTRVVSISFTPRKYVIVEPYVDVPICLTIGIPSHNIVTTKSVPLDLGKDLLESTRGVLVA
jgi:hypothetical protein